MGLTYLWQRLYLFLVNDIYNIVLTSPFAQFGIFSVLAVATVFLVRKQISKKMFFMVTLCGIAGILTIANYVGFPDYFPETQTEMVEEGETIEVAPGITRAILIKNNIEPEMLAYKHWSGTYSPTTYILSVNGEEIKPGESKIVKVVDDTLEMRHDYAFLNGKRRGGKIVRYEVPEDIELLTVILDWRDNWQIIIKNATPIDMEKTNFNDKLPL